MHRLMGQYEQRLRSGRQQDHAGRDDPPFRKPDRERHRQGDFEPRPDHGRGRTHGVEPRQLLDQHGVESAAVAEIVVELVSLEPGRIR